jgi:hypothetical protein
MVEKIYYVNNSAKLDEAIDFLRNLIPCFIDQELIEMDYSKVSVVVRVEDLKVVETNLAPLV